MAGGAAKAQRVQPPKAQAYKDKTKSGDIRTSNITAAKGILKNLLSHL